MKEQWRQVKKTLLQNRMSLYLFSLALALGGYLAVVQPGLGYKVSVNGQDIGYVRDPKAVSAMMQEIDSDLKSAHGENITYQADLSFTRGRLSTKTPLSEPAQMREPIAQSLSIKAPAWLIKADGKVLMAVRDKASAEKLLDSLKAPYRPKNKSAKIDFVQQVAILPTAEMNIEKIMSPVQALKMLSPAKAVASRSGNHKESKAAASASPLLDVRVRYQEEVQEPVYRPVVGVKDPSLLVGQEAVKSEGSNGIKKITTEHVLVNGKPKGQPAKKEEVLAAPQPKILAYGSKAAPVVSPPPVLQERAQNERVAAFAPEANQSPRASAKPAKKLEKYQAKSKNLGAGNSGIVSIASNYLGTPYRWGGTSPSGFDCSGFTQYVYRKAGVSLPRTSSAQKGVGVTVPRGQMKSGDLVFFPGHVGIYVGNGKFIHAPRPGKSVKVDTLASRKFLYAKRVR